MTHDSKKNEGQEETKLSIYWCHSQEKEVKDISVDALPDATEQGFWLDIEGTDNEKVSAVCKKYNLHDLVIESIIKEQPAHAKLFDSQLVLFFPEVTYQNSLLKTNQIAIVLTPTFLLSFHGKGSKAFQSMKQRLARAGSRLQKGNIDFFAYSIYDAVIDQGFQITSNLEECIDSLEEYFIDADRPDPSRYQETIQLKKELIGIRKVFFPMKQFQMTINQSEDELLSAEILVYFRDVGSHIQQINEYFESARERLKHVVDIYNTLVANHTNKSVQTLTLISGIFIPLSFIAGVYGMNFNAMPGISHPYGFVFTLVGMVLVGIGMIVFFKTKDWM